MNNLVGRGDRNVPVAAMDPAESEPGDPSVSIAQGETPSRGRWPLFSRWFSRDGDSSLNGGSVNSKRATPPPADPESHVQWAERALAADDVDKAQQHIAAALELQPDNAKAWALKGQIQESAGRPDEAVDAYHRAVSCEAADPEASLRLAALQIDHGHAARTAQVLRGVIECPRATDEQKSRAQWLLGVAYARMARWSEAIPALEQGATGRSMTPDDWYLLAMARFRSGDMEGARRDVETQLQAYPGHKGFASLLADLDYVAAMQGDVIPAANLVAPEDDRQIIAPLPSSGP